MTASAPRVVVVTGGAGDIGMECARRFPSQPLLLSDVSEQSLQQAAASLQADGFDVHTVQCDLARPEGAFRLVEATEAMGSLGVLIHAAGVAPPASPEVILAVNFFGSIHVLSAFERLLSPGAVGVCIASVAAYRRLAREYDPLLTSPGDASLVARITDDRAHAHPSRLAYAVSKRGLILQCQARAPLWRGLGARLVTVSPGIIGDTAMGSARARASAPLAQNGLQSSGSKRDIAEAVAFLSSADSTFITGCDLLVDGGFLADVDTQWSRENRERWHAILC